MDRYLELGLAGGFKLAILLAVLVMDIEDKIFLFLYLLYVMDRECLLLVIDFVVVSYKLNSRFQ